MFFVFLKSSLCNTLASFYMLSKEHLNKKINLPTEDVISLPSECLRFCSSPRQSPSPSTLYAITLLDRNKFMYQFLVGRTAFSSGVQRVILTSKYCKDFKIKSSDQSSTLHGMYRTLFYTPIYRYSLLK